MTMTKEKVTLTLDADRLAELRSLIDARSLSAAVDVAVDSYVAHLAHLRAVDEWLAEMDAEHGPVPAEDLEWAAHVMNEWRAGVRPSGTTG